MWCAYCLGDSHISFATTKLKTNLMYLRHFRPANSDSGFSGMFIASINKRQKISTRSLALNDESNHLIVTASEL